MFDPDSPEELSRILLLLESSPGLRLALGRASRRIISRFSCDNFAQNALRAAAAALGHSIAPASAPQIPAVVS